MHELQDSWPDEMATLATLAEAAESCGGAVRPDGRGGWKLLMPGAAPVAVQLTGVAPFPLLLPRTVAGPLALAAGADGRTLTASAFACLAQTPAPGASAPSRHPDVQSLFGKKALPGWAVKRTDGTQAELARTDQARKGWPTAVSLSDAGGFIVLEAHLPFAATDERQIGAIDAFLAGLTEGVVAIRRQPAGSRAQGAEQIVYRLAILAAGLIPEHLAAGLALLGECYHHTAAMLQGLAAQSPLAAAYRMCNHLISRRTP